MFKEVGHFSTGRSVFDEVGRFSTEKSQFSTSNYDRGSLFDGGHFSPLHRQCDILQISANILIYDTAC